MVKVLGAKIGIVGLGLALLLSSTVAAEPRSCAHRIKHIDYPEVSERNETLRSDAGCLITINWAIEQGSTNPKVTNLVYEEPCKTVGKQLENTWRNLNTTEGDPILHCQNIFRVKCLDDEPSCRFITVITRELRRTWVPYNASEGG